MGLFDSVVGAIGQQGDGHSGLMGAITDLITKQANGGLAGLLQQFQSKGLGDVAASWVGTGKNEPISGEQLNTVLGADTVQQMAAKAGVAPDALLGQLANLLPQFIDKLTPDGTLPAEGGIAQGLDALKGLFGGS